MYAFIAPISTQLRSVNKSSSQSISPRRRSRPPFNNATVRRSYVSCNLSAPNEEENNFKVNKNNSRLDIETIKKLIESESKGDQQKGLLHVKKLESEQALDLLLYSIKISKNEFIKATATIAIGELQMKNLSDELQNKAINNVINLLATAHDYGVRSAAAASMGYIIDIKEEGKNQMIESLQRALIEDGDWQVHFSCITSLGILGKNNINIANNLIKWLDSSNDLIIQSTIGALGDIGLVETLPKLLSVMGNKDMMTRQRLAQALGNIAQSIQEPSAIDALRTLLKDESFVVRESAKHALTALGINVDQVNKTSDSKNTDNSDIQNLLDNDNNDIDELDQMVRSLEQSFEELANESGQNSESDSNSNSNSDSKSNDELLNKEVKNLLSGADSDSPKESASDALRRRLERSFSKEWSFTSDSTPTTYKDMMLSKNKELKSNLSDQNDNKREKEEEAKEPLLTDRTALREIIEKMNNGEDKEKILATIELRKFENELAHEAIIEGNGLSINKTTFKVRLLSVSLLGRIGDVDLIINTLKNDPDESVRSACLDALSEAFETNNKVINLDAIDACIDSLENDDHWLVRITSAMALGNIGKGVDKVETALIDCLERKSEFQQQQDSTVKRHAITALGFLGSLKSVKVFEDMIENKDDNEFSDPSMRYRVAAALAGIESQESLSLVTKLTKDSEQFVTEMAQSTLDVLASKGIF